MARSIRSVSSSALGTGSGRRPVSSPKAALRPASTVLERHRRRLASSVTLTRLWHRFGRAIIALAFLLACMMGCLWMRTQMVQDSFTISHLTNSIAMLRQDVEDQQTRLDALNAELPQRASKLGLVVSNSSVQVDLTQRVPSGKKVAK